MKKIKIALMLSSMMFLCNCGFGMMTAGTRARVGINSNPAGATATISSTSGKTQKIITPGEVNLKKNSKYKIEIIKEGYEVETINVRKRANFTWVGLDVLMIGVFFAGIPMIITDAASGGWNYLEPELVNVTLKPRTSPISPSISPAPPPPASPSESPPASPSETPPISSFH